MPLAAGGLQNRIDPLNGHSTETSHAPFDLARLLAPLTLLVVALGAGAQNISIATGGTGGVYYPLGGGMAAVLSKYVPGMQATAEVTGGSVDNLQADRHRQALHRASRMTDAAIDALPGRGQVQGQQDPGAHADGPVPEPHARRHHRGHAASPRWPT